MGSPYLISRFYGVELGPKAQILRKLIGLVWDEGEKFIDQFTIKF